MKIVEKGDTSEAMPREREPFQRFFLLNWLE